jgi:hypothetical protein
MLEVTVPSARFNTHREQYSRHLNRIELLTLKIDNDGLSTEIRMTVEDADKLANDLLEWTKEIKGE